MRRRLSVWLFCVLVAGVSSAAHAYSNIFFFGDSLTDSGNNYIALSGNTTPVGNISGNSFIPLFPYLSVPPPGARYTNSVVWAETFAAGLGVSAVASLPGGTNFAFGGAATGPIGNAFPFSLRTQVSNQFLPSVGGNAPGDALYVIAGGGNNARSALEAVLGGADPATTIFTTALAYAVDTAAMVADLRSAGADEFLVWTTPDVGKGPAILAQGPAASAFATQLSGAMNQAMLAVLTGVPGLGDGLRVFDLFGFQNQIAANPAAFGLVNATDACGAIPGCNPATYLFWDGIHPTSAGHALIAQANLALVPEPSTYAMMLLGLSIVTLIARRRVSRG